MSNMPPVVNFARWIEEHHESLVPPVNNQSMFTTEDFIVQIVGGPNQRTDFHFEPYEEYFYQYKGNIHVNIQTEEGVRRIDINEGDMWVLPSNTWHSPQRPEEGSIGVVLEKIRPEGETEKFGWFCLECNHQVHEVELQVRNIVEDLPPVFEEFYARSDAERTCANCGAVHPGKG